MNVYFKKEDAKIYNKIISHLGDVNWTTILKVNKNIEKLEISNIFYMGMQKHTTPLEKKILSFGVNYTLTIRLSNSNLSKRNENI